MKQEVKQVARRDRELYARPVRHLCACMLGVMLLTQAAVALYAWSLADQRFLPALERKARTIAEALAARQVRAIDANTALAAAPGWDAILAQHPDIAYITLTDAAGKVLYRGGVGAEVIAPENHLDTRADIVHRFVTHGQVHVGVARDYVQARMSALRPELALLLAASLLIAFEVLWFVLTFHVSAPVRQVIAVMSHMAAGDFRFRAGAGALDGLAARLEQLAARINAGFRDVALRAQAPGQQAVGAIVLRRLRARYRFGEDGDGIELARQRVVSVRLLAFLCAFATLLAPPPAIGGGFDGAAIPAGAFVLALALALHSATRWSDRIGRRRTYVAGAVGAAAGMACAAWAPNLAALALARAAAGAGMALMLSACHGHVHDHADASGKGRGLAMLAGGAALGACCAPAVGALLAAHLGHAWAGLIASGVALLVAAVAGAVLDDSGAHARTPAARPLPLLAAGAALLLWVAFFMVMLPLATAQQDSAGLWPWLAGPAAAVLIAALARIGKRPGAPRQGP